MPMLTMMLDECVSPYIAPRLCSERVDCCCVRHRGLSSAGDHVVWQYVQKETCALVTIKREHFSQYAMREVYHAGLIVIPPAVHGKRNMITSRQPSIGLCRAMLSCQISK